MTGNPKLDVFVIFVHFLAIHGQFWRVLANPIRSTRIPPRCVSCPRWLPKSMAPAWGAMVPRSRAILRRNPGEEIGFEIKQDIYLMEIGQQTPIKTFLTACSCEELQFSSIFEKSLSVWI